MRARATAAVLAGAGLVTGLVTGVPAAVAAASPGTITTVAGGPGRGQATKVFQVPQGLAPGPGGSLYVGDNYAVRQFSSSDSFESVVAGNGANGSGGDGGPATAAQLAGALALAVDSSGNVVLVDSENCRIRVVAHSSGTFYGQAMTAGHIYTVAGDGNAGFSGDGGPATSAELSFPQGLTVDAAGNLVIGDTDNGRVRVVAASTGTFYGQAMTAGNIYTVAGGGPGGLGDGGPATKAEVSPHGVMVDSSGNLLIADPEFAFGGRIRVVAGSTGTFYGQAMTAGDIYTMAGGGTALGNGGPATGAALGMPTDVAADPAGNLVIADYGAARVRVVAEKTGTFYGQAMTAGDIYTVAGDTTTGTFSDGGLATSTHLSQPQTVTFDAAGNLIIADSGYDRVWAVPAKTGRFYGRPMTAHHIYFVAGNGRLGFSGSGGKATSAEIPGRYMPGKVTIDGSNYVVAASNQAWFIANKTGTYFGRAMTGGDIYVVAGDGFKGYSGDGGIATSARLTNPDGVAVDAAGNLVIADTDNDRVRVVAAATGTFYGQAMIVGHIYTVAGGGTNGFGDGGPATAAEVFPRGVAVDGAGNLVIADDGARQIRVVAASTGTFYGQAMTAGDIYGVAGNGERGFGGDGGPATAARVTPYGVAVDGSGNLVIASATSNRIRVVAASTGTFYGQAMTAGDIYRVAGTGALGGSGDGGPATAASFAGPEDVAVDGSGNLVIVDTGNERVRVVAEKSGTFYGVAMTPGDVYTVAGNGTLGSSGDGGPATAAELFSPSGVAVDGAGNLVIDDASNGRVRLVTG